MPQRSDRSLTLTHRFATEADFPLLAGLNAQLVEDEGHHRRWSQEQLAGMWHEWLRQRYYALLFEHQGVVVAYALYRADEDASIYLRHFFVCREQRRKGIGQKAIRMLIDEIWPRGARITLDVLLHNEAARSFWGELGFKPYAVSMELDTSTGSEAPCV